VDLVELGRVLKERREESGLRRADLARRSGVSQGYIGNVEVARRRVGGKPSRPTREVLLSWTRALGMDESERERVLRLAGYSEFEGSMARSVLPALETSVEFWDEQRDVIASQVKEIMRRAQEREDGREILDYLRLTLEMLTERVSS
jgi:transcriptional regulator with XRE-family HTH domain